MLLLSTAAALLAVHRAPWDGTPDCPFITDLFTGPGFRRRGLARVLADVLLGSDD